MSKYDLKSNESEWRANQKLSFCSIKNMISNDNSLEITAVTKSNLVELKQFFLFFTIFSNFLILPDFEYLRMYIISFWSTIGTILTSTGPFVSGLSIILYYNIFSWTMFVWRTKYLAFLKFLLCDNNFTFHS